MDDWNYDGQAQAGRMEDNIPGVQDAGLASWGGKILQEVWAGIG